MIDENDHHHPASPLVSLVSVHDDSVAGLLTEEDSNHTDVEDRQPEVDWSKVLVLLHKEVGSVTQIKVSNNDGELGYTEDEVGDVVGWKIALNSWPGRGRSL